MPGLTYSSSAVRSTEMRLTEMCIPSMQCCKLRVCHGFLDPLEVALDDFCSGFEATNRSCARGAAFRVYAGETHSA